MYAPPLARLVGRTALEGGRSRVPATTAGVTAGVTADQRGVSPIIGAILMFGLALALLMVLQTTAVPALNEQIEFQHSERVEADILAVEETVDRTAATGAEQSVRVETGLRYPARMFFVNPPPVAGTIRTTDPATVAVANARAAGEAGDYWNGTRRRFETRALVYAPDYNEYPNAPTTVYEPGAVYSRFDDATRPLTDESLVDGRRITLVALDGRVSTSAARRVSLAVEPVSAPARVVAVRDDGDPVTLTVPTRLTEDAWERLLEDELDPAGDPTNDRYVTDFDCRQSTGPCERLTLTLEEGATYELRLGKVALGGAATEPEATYLVDVAGDETSVPEGGSQKLVVEVHDRLDNRVSGVAVNASLDGDGTVRAVTPVTGSDGRAAFVYEAPDDVDGTAAANVTATFGGGRPREAVTFDVRVMDSDGSGSGGSPGPGGSDPSANIAAVNANTAGNQDRYDVSVDAADPDGDLDRVEFELRDPDTGTVIDSASTTVSGTNDTATERLSASGRDRLSEYRIVVTAFDAAGNTGSDATTVTGSG